MTAHMKDTHAQKITRTVANDIGPLVCGVRDHNARYTSAARVERWIAVFTELVPLDAVDNDHRVNCGRFRLHHL